jgi:protein-disulfide isomerase
MGASSISAAEQTKVAEFKSQAINLDDINQANALEIFDAETKLYELRMQNLRQLLISKLIKLDVRSKGLSDDQFIRRFILNLQDVSQQQVDAFITQRQIPASKINANLKGQVKKFLMEKQIAEQIDRWFKLESQKHNIAIYLEQPQEPRFNVNTDGAAFRGGKNAAVTIIEFSDFQCPYCTRANETLNELSELYGDKIKIVYKHFPLTSIHPEAAKAGEASLCAQEQSMDKFWQMHDKLFEKQRSLSTGVMKDLAKDLELNTEQFNQCLTSNKYASRVQADFDEGAKLGVSSTPAFYINGRFLKGAQPLNAFQTIIDEELKRVNKK